MMITNRKPEDQVQHIAVISAGANPSGQSLFISRILCSLGPAENIILFPQEYYEQRSTERTHLMLMLWFPMST